MLRHPSSARPGACSTFMPLVAGAALAVSGCATSLPELPEAPVSRRPAAAAMADPHERLAYPFDRGEELTYAARLAGMPAGAVRVRVGDAAAEGRLSFELAAASSRLVSLLYALRQTMTVECDADSLRPRIVRSDADVDGNARRQLIVFDADSDTATTHRTDAKGTTVRVLSARDAFDPLTLFYVVRSLTPEVPALRTFNVVTGPRAYRVDVSLVSRQSPDDVDEELVGGIDGDVLRVEALAWTVPHGSRRIARDDEPQRARLRARVSAWLETGGARRLLRLEHETPLGLLELSLDEGERPREPVASNTNR